MENLDRYAQFFDTAYPEYTDARYAEIAQLVSRYDSATALSAIEGQQFRDFVALVQPLIAIKNYKSQVPFPEKVREVVNCIIRIRSAPIGSPDLFANHHSLFEQLISLQGFQLPTVSAVFHFYHPSHFPIIDVNVEAACALLKQRFPNDFARFVAPVLPAPNTSVTNKLNKYAAFIAFIGQVISLQRVHEGNPTYRYVDKALMVLGVPKLRTQVENRAAR